MREPYLSLVFPAYNEELRLPRSLETVMGYLERNNIDSEIIVVDDGSSDGTAEAAERCLQSRNFAHKIISLEKNSGKGFAVKTGLEAASGSFVFFSDSDLSTPIEELATALSHLTGGYDIAIASRGMKNSKLEARQNILREIGGRTFNLIVQLLALPGIKDTQCGFKGFRRAVIAPITARQKLRGFSFDIEMLWIAKRLGFKIYEFPATWRHDPASKVNVARDSVRMIRDLFKMKRMHKNTDFRQDQ